MLTEYKKYYNNIYGGYTMVEDKKQVLLKYGSGFAKEIQTFKDRRYPHLTMTGFFLEVMKNAIEEDKRK